MNRKLASILALLLGLCQALAHGVLASPVIESNEDIDASTRILAVNEGISEFLIEGDVAIPRGRNAKKCSNCRWEKSPSGLVEVPYNITEAFSPQQKAAIEKAMQTFHEKTCVRFVPYVTQEHYINIESRSGCWAYVGRTGGKQTVSLSTNGCLWKAVIQHELLHALGFHHEQNRSDRDKYIRINWEWIKEDRAYNFNKQDSNNLNTTYDYGSIMHYRRYGFSTTPGKETMTPIPNPDVKLGGSVMTETDILKINRLYECEDSETSTNATLKDLRQRLEVTESQVKGLVSQIKALENQFENVNQKMEIKVAFSATLQTKRPYEFIGPFEKAFTLKYANVITNVGSAYDPKTGMFTAPVKGVYFFTFAVFNPWKNASGVTLMRNGEMVVSATDQAPGVDTEDTTTNSATLLLEASDQVYIQMLPRTGIYTDGNRRNTFNGHLLYTM